MNSPFKEPFTFGGLRIYVDYPTPKVVVHRYWWLSEDTHDAIQRRMIALFGYNKGVVEQGQVLVWGDRAIVHPADMATLRKIA